MLSRRQRIRLAQAADSLSPELLRAVSDGRARITRGGAVVPAAPQSRSRSAYSHALRLALDSNPNRGLRHAARIRPAANTEQPYRPLTVATPLRDALGRRKGRGQTHSSYTV